MSDNNINNLIDFAIGQEHDAAEFYQEAADKVTNPGVKKIFQELAQDEKGHANLLEKYKNDNSIAEKFKTTHTDYKIAETLAMPELSISLKPADAIAIAVKREQAAAEFYKAMAASAVNPNEKETFVNLANMELGHKHKLENVFVEIGYPEVF